MLASECFAVELSLARLLVDVCICRAAKGPEVGEVGHLIRDHEPGNIVCSYLSCSAPDVDHGHEGMSPKLV
jgi:hypothetical protein